VRLVEVALDSGAPAAYLVDSAEGLDAGWLDGVTTVGLSSGASAPEELVQGVLVWLAEHGFDDVVEVTSAQESLLFALPPELRRDMRAAGATAG
jgi:4-hydroxy-3-methylbut-2-enyl diphosphate reductase